MPKKRVRPLLLAAATTTALTTGVAFAAVPGGDVRLTHDAPGTGGYVSNYTLTTGVPYTDPGLSECSVARGRQNEPSVSIDPRNPSVIIGSSNDYCGVYASTNPPVPV